MPYFGSFLGGNSVLPEVRRSYAATIDGRYLLGDALALQHYLARQKASKQSQGPAAR